MTSQPHHDWFSGMSSYYPAMSENHAYVDESSALDFPSPFEPRHGQRPYPYFPSQGYLPLIQETRSEETTTKVADPADRNNEIFSLLQALDQRLEKLEQVFSETQTYIKQLVPWSMRVHDSFTELMTKVSEGQLGTSYKRTAEGNNGMQEEGEYKNE